ncbi:MAG: RluA family pseudouridine synthase [Proteobacteria bacterium]|jgi:23S rRNA pseudouridine955/2504/2580 synthase|nr:RluA family pseudouridine synthase [Pseudomonadota bacterium]MDA1239066.1 RluA family pseudouridine synthase [Pseudomonadota bacterium]
MSRIQYIDVGSDESEQRLDRWFRRHFPHISQGRIEKMCRKGEIRVNGGRVKSNSRVSPGQTLRIPPLPSTETIEKLARESHITKADAMMIRNCVIYKDDYLLVLNKPAGIPVQGGSKQVRHIDGMSEALRFDREDTPRLVHRLDKDTSGVLVLARTQAMASELTKAFRHRATRKIYWALVAGVPYPKIGTIKYGLVKSSGGEGNSDRERMHCVHPNEITKTDGAKRAHTDYATLCFLAQRAAWMALVPVTGRTHQLRAHMAELGHPIVGDGKYGLSGQNNHGDGWGSELGDEISNKMHLHARSLRIEHPITGEEMTFTAPLPDHMKKTWDFLGWTDADAPNDPFDSTEEWQK